MPEGGAGTAEEFPGGKRAELVLGSSPPYPLSKLVLEDLDKSRVRDPALANTPAQKDCGCTMGPSYGLQGDKGSGWPLGYTECWE